jgi:hypothetical protein
MDKREAERFVEIIPWDASDKLLDMLAPVVRVLAEQRNDTYASLRQARAEALALADSLRHVLEGYGDMHPTTAALYVQEVIDNAKVS